MEKEEFMNCNLSSTSHQTVSRHLGLRMVDRLRVDRFDREDDDLLEEITVVRD